MIWVNFKTYREATGKKAVELAGLCESVGKTSGVKIIPVVQAVDLYRVTRAVKISVWLQHLDWQPPGQHTGRVNLEAAVEAGAGGVILNHSEHRLPPGMIKQTIGRIKNSKSEGLRFEVLVCCRSFGQAEKLAKFRPDFLAYEPPELIGSRTASVAIEKPALIHRMANQIKPVPIVVGAGIHSRKDVEISLKLGARGVLVATAVVKAKDPEKELLDLARGFKDRD